MRIGAGNGPWVAPVDGVEAAERAARSDADPLGGREVKDPVATAKKLAEKLGDQPQAVAKLAQKIQGSGRAEEPNVKLLLLLLILLLEAIAKGQLGDFIKALGQGGGLGGLANGLGGNGLGQLLNQVHGGGGGVNFREMRPWSEEDRQFIDQALISEPENFGDLISNWAQGQEGNCASVATIKAAMDRYDNRVFDQVDRVGDGYRVKMQDGAQVDVTGSELSMARAASNFKGIEGPAKAYAHLCYAAMAKRAMLEGHEGSRNYAQALHSLNNGEFPYKSARFLGLEGRTISVNPYTLNGQDSVVGWNGSHAIFVNKNRDGTHTSDHYGRGYRFNGTDTNGLRLSSAFTLRPRAAAPAPRPAQTQTPAQTPRPPRS